VVRFEPEATLPAMKGFMVRIAIAALLLASSVAAAGAIDLKINLKELRPCRAAAASMCDRSHGLTTAALWKCGATLASRHTEVGGSCVAVLKRYGQL
jgi:hypothetical protein